MISIPSSRLTKPPRLSTTTKQEINPIQLKSQSKLTLNILTFVLAQNNQFFPTEETDKYMKLFNDFLIKPDDLELPFNIISTPVQPLTSDHLLVSPNGISFTKQYFQELSQIQQLKAQISQPQQRKPLSPCQTRPLSGQKTIQETLYTPLIYSIDSGVFSLSKNIEQDIKIYIFSTVKFYFQQTARISKFDVEYEEDEIFDQQAEIQGEFLNFIDDNGICLEGKKYCEIGQIGEINTIDTIIYNISRIIRREIKFLSSELINVEVYCNSYDLKKSYQSNFYYQVQFKQPDFLILDYDQFHFGGASISLFGPNSHMRKLIELQENFLSISKKETRLPAVITELYVMLNTFTKSGLVENFSYGLIELNDITQESDIYIKDEDFGDLRFDTKRLVKECLDAINSCFQNKKVQKLNVYGKLMNFSIIRDRMFEICQDIEIIQ
ncbi:hypothetical protein SS50377_20299 [Spironucleus salmonicida]|uniref:Uncharacterized protein n=1 Tax=Spironucleus salmonicida TaxID=348837 RepID=V6LMA8_9EUKA|nr:hypothetical protein SS50377_20299 [Spironucleus salmonicida]|eukprot:EST45353.1 Hypothetical protein SS50377_14933 [Spironucleus salmonicida]